MQQNKQTFTETVLSTLREMIPKTHDDYREIRYNDTLYIHVWSHDDGDGYFEIDVIVPHDRGYDTDAPTLSAIDGTDELRDALHDAVHIVTDDDRTLEFHLVEVVDDGVWERDANVYSTFRQEV